ncbi:FtsH protease activity modulator HflK [Azoarcus sp. KH32C]|uniref:FtsH protease activity modulator HflK n=1 Tax=Azoarcus sp. KH32C TaxID=748247 RepID=UPI00023866CC|nr:FtsH protease activity modulator HflK [Azoarcus sp. KH32C]BAL23152.1 band 7 family protein [Azoarcus sp. KH32C]
MSLNDPRWGNQGNGDGKRGDDDRGANQGPPDLEDLWRDFNRRLSGMLAGKRGPRTGGDGNGPQLPKVSFRQFGGGMGVLAALVGAVWLASGFYIVDANQRGVVLRFGKYVETTEPGLRWRLPYPVETSDVVDVGGVRTVEIGYRGTERNKVLREALMLTDDENIINIQFAVQYILTSPEKFLFNNRYPDEAVTQAAETAMREIVGKSKMDFVLYEGREQIAAAAQESIQKILDRYDTGIQISRVTMQNAQPPEQVQAAFDDAVKAGQDRERLRNEGEAYANDVIPRARGTASRLLEEANAYRARVVANAEGEAARFTQVLGEYRRAPEVTRERLYLDTMQQVMTRSSKVMIDTKAGGNLLYLPLDKLMHSAGGQGGHESSPPAPAATAPAAGGARADSSADPRSRDVRDRERGER